MHNVDLGRARQYGANRQAVRAPVHSQHRERIAVLGAHEGLDFGVGKLHASGLGMRVAHQGTPIAGEAAGRIVRSAPSQAYVRYRTELARGIYTIECVAAAAPSAPRRLWWDSQWLPFPMFRQTTCSWRSPAPSWSAGCQSLNRSTCRSARCSTNPAPAEPRLFPDHGHRLAALRDGERRLGGDRRGRQRGDGRHLALHGRRNHAQPRGGAERRPGFRLAARRSRKSSTAPARCCTCCCATPRP